MNFKLLIALLCMSMVSSAPYGMDLSATEPSVLVEQSPLQLEETTAKAYSYESSTVPEPPKIELPVEEVTHAPERSYTSSAVEVPKVEQPAPEASTYSYTQPEVAVPRVEQPVPTTQSYSQQPLEVKTFSLPPVRLEVTAAQNLEVELSTESPQMDVSTMGYGKKKRSGYNVPELVEVEVTTAQSYSSYSVVAPKVEFPTTAGYSTPELVNLPVVKQELTTVGYASSSVEVPKIQIELSTVNYDHSVVTEVVTVPKLEVFEVSTKGYGHHVEVATLPKLELEVVTEAYSSSTVQPVFIPKLEFEVSTMGYGKRSA